MMKKLLLCLIYLLYLSNINATYTAKVWSGKGSISVVKNADGSHTLTAIPASGYIFDHWYYSLYDQNSGTWWGGSIYSSPSRHVSAKNVQNKDDVEHDYVYFSTSSAKFTLSVKSNNTSYGVVTGGGSYAINTIVTIKATPKTGYHFVKWNDGNKNASRQITVTADATYTATFEADAIDDTEKILTGVFSISDTMKVCFSSGNLQYTNRGNHSCADGSTQKGTWRFAEHQYDYIGKDNANVSSTYGGWIDLFGFGTSGWNSGAACYRPYDTSQVNTKYLNQDLIGEYQYADWGVYNAIINGGDEPNQWRLLTQKEAEYIINNRPNASQLKAIGCVNGIEGVILLPDNWKQPQGIDFHSGFGQQTSFNVFCEINQYALEQWNIMEKNGAVFLPHPRCRIGSSYSNKGIYLLYKTSTNGGLETSYTISCAGTNLSVNSSDKNKSNGCAVRLVQEAPKATITTIAQNGSITGSGSYYIGDTATLSVTPADCYHFLKWSDNNTSNPRNVKVSQDSTLTAIFEKINYTLSIDLNDPTHGNIESKETNE